MTKLFWIAAAGALGTLARYGLGGLVQRLGGATFPWGTLSVNIIGSFLFGLIWALASEKAIISSEMRIIILAGFMGAFTTFSTFMFETGGLMRESQWLLTAANLLTQNILGLAAVFLGWAASRLF